MAGEPKGWHSRGYLPHFDSPDRIQHLVFRTLGSLPRAVAATLPSERTARRRAIDRYLDRSGSDERLGGPAAKVVQDALLHFDGERYRMLAWCVMPNHVHVVCESLQGFSIGMIVKSWKSFSAGSINRTQGASGRFWAPDYFDRYMRDEDDFVRTVNYVENNPVVAGLVKKATDWPWTSARRALAQERA